MVPMVHGAAADAALADVGNAYVPPFGATQFALLGSGWTRYPGLHAEQRADQPLLH